MVLALELGEACERGGCDVGHVLLGRAVVNHRCSLSSLLPQSDAWPCVVTCQPHSVHRPGPRGCTNRPLCPFVCQDTVTSVTSVANGAGPVSGVTDVTVSWSAHPPSSSLSKPST